MKNLQTFEEFINESKINEAVKGFDKTILTPAKDWRKLLDKNGVKYIESIKPLVTMIDDIMSKGDWILTSVKSKQLNAMMNLSDYYYNDGDERMKIKDTILFPGGNDGEPILKATESSKRTTYYLTPLPSPYKLAKTYSTSPGFDFQVFTDAEVNEIIK